MAAIHLVLAMLQYFFLFLNVSSASSVSNITRASHEIVGREGNVLRVRVDRGSCETFTCKVCLSAYDVLLVTGVDAVKVNQVVDNALALEDWCFNILWPFYEYQDLRIVGWTPTHVRKVEVNLFVRDQIDWGNVTADSKNYFQGMFDEVLGGLGSNTRSGGFLGNSNGSRPSEISEESDSFYSGYLSLDVEELLNASDFLFEQVRRRRRLQRRRQLSGGDEENDEEEEEEEHERQYLENRRQLAQAVNDDLNYNDTTIAYLRQACQVMSDNFFTLIYEPNQDLLARGAELEADLNEYLAALGLGDDPVSASSAEQTPRANLLDKDALRDRCLAKAIVEISSRCLSLNTEDANTGSCVEGEMKRVTYDTTYTLQTIYNKNLIFWRTYASGLSELGVDLNYTENLQGVLDDIENVNSLIGERTEKMASTLALVQDTVTDVVAATAEQNAFLLQANSRQLAYFEGRNDEVVQLFDLVSDLSNVLYGVETLILNMGRVLRKIATKNLAYIRVISQRGAQSSMLMADIHTLLKRVERDLQVHPALHRTLMAAIASEREDGWEPWFYTPGAAPADVEIMKDYVRGPAVSFLRMGEFEPVRPPLVAEEDAVFGLGQGEFPVYKYTARFFCRVDVLGADSRNRYSPSFVEYLFEEGAENCYISVFKYRARRLGADRRLAALNLLYHLPWVVNVADLDLLAAGGNLSTGSIFPDFGGKADFVTQKLAAWWALKENPFLLDAFGTESLSQHLPWCAEDASLVWTNGRFEGPESAFNRSYTTILNSSAAADICQGTSELDFGRSFAPGRENRSFGKYLSLFGWVYEENTTVTGVEAVHDWLREVVRAPEDSPFSAEGGEVAARYAEQGSSGDEEASEFLVDRYAQAYAGFGRENSILKAWCGDDGFRGNSSRLEAVASEVFGTVLQPFEWTAANQSAFSLRPRSPSNLAGLYAYYNSTYATLTAAYTAPLADPAFLGDGVGGICGAVRRQSAVLGRAELAAAWEAMADLLNYVPPPTRIVSHLPMPANCSLRYADSAPLGASRSCSWSDSDHSDGRTIEYGATVLYPYSLLAAAAANSSNLSNASGAEARVEYALQANVDDGYVLSNAVGGAQFFYSTFVGAIDAMTYVAEQAQGDLSGSWPNPLFLQTTTGRPQSTNALDVSRRGSRGQGSHQRKNSAHFLTTSATEEPVFKASRRVKKFLAYLTGNSPFRQYTAQAYDPQTGNLTLVNVTEQSAAVLSDAANNYFYYTNWPSANGSGSAEDRFNRTGLVGAAVSNVRIRGGNAELSPTELYFVGNPLCWNKPCYYRPTRLKKVPAADADGQTAVYYVVQAARFTANASALEQDSLLVSVDPDQPLCENQKSATGGATDGPVDYELFPLGENSGRFPLVFDIDQADFRSPGVQQTSSPLSYYKPASAKAGEAEKDLLFKNARVSEGLQVFRVGPLHSYFPINGPQRLQVEKSGISAGDMIARVASTPSRCGFTASTSIRDALERSCAASISAEGTGLCDIFANFYVSAPGTDIALETPLADREALRLYPKDWTAEVALQFSPDQVNALVDRVIEAYDPNFFNQVNLSEFFSKPASSGLYPNCPDKVQSGRNAQGQVQVRFTNLDATSEKTGLRFLDTCDITGRQGPDIDGRLIFIKPLSTYILQVPARDDCASRTLTLLGRASTGEVTCWTQLLADDDGARNAAPALATVSDPLVTRNNAVKLYNARVLSRTYQTSQIMLGAIRDIQRQEAVAQYEEEIRLLITNHTIEALGNDTNLRQKLTDIANGKSFFANVVADLSESESVFLAEQAKSYNFYNTFIQKQSLRVKNLIDTYEATLQNRTALWNLYQELKIQYEQNVLLFQVERNKYTQLANELEYKIQDSLGLLSVANTELPDCCTRSDLEDMSEIAKAIQKTIDLAQATDNAAEDLGEATEEAAVIVVRDMYSSWELGVVPSYTFSKKRGDEHLARFLTTMFYLSLTVLTLNLLSLSLTGYRKTTFPECCNKASPEEPFEDVQDTRGWRSSSRSTAALGDRKRKGEKNKRERHRSGETQHLITKKNHSKQFKYKIPGKKN